MPNDGPSLSGDQYQERPSKDDLLAGEQYMQQRKQKSDDEINAAAKTFSGGSGILSSGAPKAIRGLFGGK